MRTPRGPRIPDLHDRSGRGVGAAERMAALGGVRVRATAGRSGPPRKGPRALGAVGRVAAVPDETVGNRGNRFVPGCDRSGLRVGRRLSGRYGQTEPTIRRSIIQ